MSINVSMKGKSQPSVTLHFGPKMVYRRKGLKRESTATATMMTIVVSSLSDNRLSKLTGDSDIPSPKRTTYSTGPVMANKKP